jgi:hypothetical protein
VMDVSRKCGAATQLSTELVQPLTLVFSLVALLASGLPSAAKGPLRIEDRVVLTKASPACVRREEFDRLVELAAQHDASGFVQYMTDRKCPVLKVGTTAIYYDSGFSGRAMCIRPLGETDCLWIPSAAAQKADRVRGSSLRE